MKISWLVRGLPGHPLHPPLTDATIGIYTASMAFAVLSVLNIGDRNPAYVWWLTLALGLLVTAPTALTGFLDWLTIDRDTPLWRTATIHMLAMLSATALFGLAAVFGYDGYRHGAVHAGPFVLTLVGYGLLTVGGWLGGAIVYVHGMRVLELPGEPTRRAAAPVAHSEKERAEG